MTTRTPTSDLLKQIYYDESHPASYSSAAKLYKAAKKHLPNVTLKQVQEFLRGEITYTLHKSVRRNFPREKILVSSVDEQWQADLVDLKHFSRQNSGYKFILTVIDIFSKYAWAVSLRTKGSSEVLNAFKRIFQERKPSKLQTDKGTEFLNAPLKRYLKENEIMHFTTNDEKIKCAVVERFNRTLKSKMFKYFTAKGTRRYIDILPNVIRAYNHTTHRITKKRPNEVTREKAAEVFYNTYGVSSVREYLRLYSKRKTKLKEGDKVRIPYSMNPLEKGYYPNWTDEIFTISNSIKGRSRSAYRLKDNSNETIKGRFYPEEVQKVCENIYRVERVLKSRNYRGQKQYYVKWLNFPSTYNSWINEGDLKND